jgi:hypothetical protein
MKSIYAELQYIRVSSMEQGPFFLQSSRLKDPDDNLANLAQTDFGLISW